MERTTTERAALVALLCLASCNSKSSTPPPAGVAAPASSAAPSSAPSKPAEPAKPAELARPTEAPKPAPAQPEAPKPAAPTAAKITTEAKYPGAAVTTEWTTTPSGLKYAEIAAGTGAKPKSSSSRVRVHYTGWLLDGKKFDSSVDRGQPAVFPLNGVIAGWTEGVGSMQVGGKRKLVIPFKLAYGENGRPGTIPPRADLVFDVELIEIVGD